MEILLCTGTVSQFVVAAIVFTSFDRRHGQEIDVACSSVLPTTYLLFSLGKVKGKAGKAEQRMLCLQIQVYLHTSIIPLYCLLIHRSCTLEFVDDFLPTTCYTTHNSHHFLQASPLNNNVSWPRGLWRWCPLLHRGLILTGSSNIDMMIVARLVVGLVQFHVVVCMLDMATQICLLDLFDVHRLS